ncbi:beta-caryophyllene synthase [Tanacetum coccineum]
MAYKITVTPGDSSSTQKVNSIKAGHDNLHDVNDGETLSNFTAKPNKGTSYANLFTSESTTGESTRKSLNFFTLFTPGGNGVDVVVPVESIRAISKWFANMAYGFFLGKSVAFPGVANYVRNTWGKYGLVKSMLNSSTRIFSFQFSSIEGLDAVTENGQGFIRNNPLILKKLNPDVNLLEKDMGNVLVWVKLYGVPVTAFSKDGLSAIATKLGTPLMLNFIHLTCAFNHGVGQAMLEH